MIIGDNAGEVWAKALRDEELTPTEAVRLGAMVQEMAYSAVATAEIWNSTGQEHLVEALPSYLAGQLTSSETMRRAWETVSDEMRLFGWEALALETRARLERAEANS